jgi:starch phosphorylase
MKAAMNGVLNVSILDGWWEEGYEPDVGWAIGRGERYESDEIQDEVESKALYDLLEREIIPAFYDRGLDGLPRKWIEKMKQAIAVVGSGFASHRMLMEYHERFYRPAAESHLKLTQNGYRPAKELHTYLQRIRSAFSEIEILEMECNHPETVKVGEELEFRATVDLGPLHSEDLLVELIHGPVNALDEFSTISRVPMTCKNSGEHPAIYSVTATSSHTGLQGFSVRILPVHQALIHPFLPGLVKWADGTTER